MNECSKEQACAKCTLEVTAGALCSTCPSFRLLTKTTVREQFPSCPQLDSKSPALSHVLSAPPQNSQRTHDIAASNHSNAANNTGWQCRGTTTYGRATMRQSMVCNTAHTTLHQLQSVATLFTLTTSTNRWLDPRCGVTSGCPLSSSVLALLGHTQQALLSTKYQCGQKK